MQVFIITYNFFLKFFVVSLTFNILKCHSFNFRCCFLLLLLKTNSSGTLCSLWILCHKKPTNHLWCRLTWPKSRTFIYVNKLLWLVKNENEEIFMTLSIVGLTPTVNWSITFSDLRLLGWNKLIWLYVACWNEIYVMFFFRWNHHFLS